MLFDSLKFIEVSFNGANNRNIILEVSKVKTAIPADGENHYICLFRYEASLKRHVEEHGSVKGHNLPHYADYITFDIDEKDDLPAAQTSTRAIVDKLTNLGIEPEKIGVAFSGAKGFHVQVPSSLFGVEPHTNNAKTMKALCAEIAGDVKLDGSIYDKNRLFRLRNTRNGKTGLFKVDLGLEMIFGPLEAILEYAKEPQAEIKIGNNFSTRQNLAALWKKAGTVKERQSLNSKSTVEVPKFAKACIHKMLQGVPDGMIHNASFRLANHFHKQGFPANIIRGLLEGWGPLNEVPAQEDFRRMAEEAGDYDFGCNDDILKSFCDQKCHLFKTAQVDTSDIMNMEDQLMAYAEHIRNLKKACFITGFPDLDCLIRGVAPGEVMFIIAYSGLFKSALLQNLLLNAGRRNGSHHLFFSLEMPVAMVFERTVQISCEIEGYTVENSFKDSLYQEELYKKMVMAGANKLLVCQKGGLTIEQVKSYTTIAREKYGEIGAIGIDYLGLMQATGKQTEYDRISYCSENAKQMAKELNIPVIVLAQINRQSAGGDVEKWSAKGSGAIEASADFMIGLQKDDSDQLIMRLLKNRKGAENVDFIVEMNKNYLQFVSLIPADARTEKKVERKTRVNNNPTSFTEKEQPCPY